MLQIVASLTDDSRGAIYDRNKFIVSSLLSHFPTVLTFGFVLNRKSFGFKNGMRTNLTGLALALGMLKPSLMAQGLYCKASYDRNKLECTSVSVTSTLV